MARKKTARRTKGREKIRLGIIGGSGLYNMAGLGDVREVKLKTPFGAPSDAFLVGTLEGQRVAFLARHARGHRLLPGEINFRANMYGMKLLGVERIVSVSAVGSLRDDLPPGDFMLPDQFYDRTAGRASTFFGGGLVAHVSFDKPTCPHLSDQLADACLKAGVRAHLGGTYICMEGPQFSTLAESNANRVMKFDIVGMTNVTEAKLAREGEMCYATLAMVTDFDCWHPGHDAVTLADILAVLQRNTENVQRVICEAVRAGLRAPDGACKCARALASAIVTDKKLVPPATRKRLHAIVGRYFA
jgi:5'-methylthioadenosine phosphorylase